MRGRKGELVQTEQEIRQVVVDLVHEIDGKADADVAPDSSLGAGGLELTSLEVVRILVGLEEQLGVELEDGAIMNSRLEVVDDLVSLVVDCASELEPVEAGA
jgi:acyl carrier protein